ncbi:hypothetical protein Avbf_08860 [Armadillidium vulgare]|nr:hypothetical protein Avbf_08860 [Armadillidium vulgare]
MTYSTLSIYLHKFGALWYFGVSFVVTIVKAIFFIWFIEKPVDEYLNEWGFSSVSSVFKDEGIDEEAFLLLTPEFLTRNPKNEECLDILSKRKLRNHYSVGQGFSSNFHHYFQI